MTRTKRKAETVPAARDRDEAARFVARIGELDRDIALQEAALAEAYAQAKATTAATVAQHDAERNALTRGVQIWAEANRHALTDGGKSKTVDLGTGTVAWRQGRPSVSIKGAKEVLQQLIDEGREEFLRRKVEIDKAAMLAMPDAANAIPGVRVGSDGEEFVIEAAGAREMAS